MTSTVPEERILAVRDASRRLVRELGFMKATLADSRLPPSAVHALVEIGARGSLTATALCELLVLEKSSVSRMVRKLIDAHLLVEEISTADARARGLSLTDDGRATLAAIDRFANAQVNSALEALAAGEGQAVLDGLECYAQALRTCRLGKRERRSVDVTIANGYRPGVIGRTVEMHARYYARTVAFGQFFERKVASELAEFAGRLEHPGIGLWVAERGSEIVGAISIDGEDLGAGIAHLRWFIVADGCRGSGIGRSLLAEAIAFCERKNFAEIHLWTFQGLDAARRLYERHGFALAEEKAGSQWGSEVVEQRFVRTSAH